jgi:hypothetical protein
MTKLKTTQYTLVQHSAAGYKHDPTFDYAVEERLLSLDSHVKAVQAAGGVLFDSYMAASDAAEAENYPPEVESIVPHVRGHFSRQDIDGLRIYVPLRQAVQAEA